MKRPGLIVALLAAAIVLVVPGVAAAHSELIVSNPEAGATVTTALPEVALTFNQDINHSFANITVTDEGGGNWTGEPTVDGKIVRAPLLAGLANASYTVSYQVVSADGHTISGSYRFTYTANDPVAAAVITPPPASAAPADRTESTATLRWALVAALAAIVVGGLAVVFFAGRRGKN